MKKFSTFPLNKLLFPTFINNWQPEHFPAGTVVVLGNNLNDGKTLHFSDKDFTVKSCAQTSLGDWLVITDTWNVMLDIWEPHNFNSIIGIKKRGIGPVVTTSTFFPKEPMRNLKKMVAYDDLNKNKYICKRPYIGELFNHLVKKYLPFGLFIDKDFIHFFLSQTWIDINYQDNSYSFSKKKANRFIKQNINRWIKPMKKARLDFEDQKRMELEGMLSLVNFASEIPKQNKMMNGLIRVHEKFPYPEERLEKLFYPKERLIDITYGFIEQLEFIG